MIKIKKNKLIILGIIPFIYTIVSLIITNKINEFLVHIPSMNIYNIFVILEGEYDIENIYILIEGIFQIIGLVLIAIGILNKPEENTVNKLKKYKILKIMGYFQTIISILFILLVSFLTFYTDFNYTTSDTIFFCSLSLSLVWPLIYIGLILILKSNKLIKKINIEKM